MRYLWIIFLFIPGLVLAQDKYPYELPEYTTVANDSTDVLYIDDSGIDKHIEMPTLLGAINDTADQLRLEIDSAKVNIRGEMGGVSAFSKSGSQVSLTSSTDTLNLGGNYDEKLSVNGGGYFNAGDITVTGNGTTGGNVNAYILNLNQNAGSSGKVFSLGDDLYLGDNTNGWKKLSDLASSFSLLNTTIRPILSTYNLNLGSTSQTTYKLNVVGNVNVVGDFYKNGSLFTAGLSDTIKFLTGVGKIYPAVTHDGFYFNTSGSSIYPFTLSTQGTSYVSGSNMYELGFSPHSTIASASEGNMYYDTEDHQFYYHNGTSVVPFGGGVGNVVSEAIAGGNFAMFRTADTIIDCSSLTGWSLISSYGVGVRTVTDNIYLASTEAGSIILENKAYFEDTVHYKYLNLSVGDTVGIIAIGSTERADSASLVSGADGWTVKYSNYLKFYLQAKKLKALPLPYPNSGTLEAHGQERRKINAKFGSYQIERELERIHHYFIREWVENKVQSIIIILLIIGFVYQQRQIKRLKK